LSVGSFVDWQNRALVADALNLVMADGVTVAARAGAGCEFPAGLIFGPQGVQFRADPAEGVAAEQHPVPGLIGGSHLVDGFGRASGITGNMPGVNVAISLRNAPDVAW
jgi:hypothetical protein